MLLVVLWRLRYKLSLRDLTEMFLAREITFTHETVRLWEERFAPLITAKLKAEKKEHLTKKPSLPWKTDETYLKIGKKQVYLYRAIDEFGNLVDLRLSQTRDLEAAKAFFRQALEITGRKLRQVTSDKLPVTFAPFAKFLAKKWSTVPISI